MNAYQKHYFRLCTMYAGPNLSGMREAGPRRVDAIGLKAMAALRRVYQEGRPGLIEALAFTGARWESGWKLFEERVRTIGSTYNWGALTSRQAA